MNANETRTQIAAKAPQCSAYPNSIRDGAQVHVRRRDGSLIYTRLLNGAERLEFESGYGWVSVADLVPNGWTVHEGWPLTRAHQALLFSSGRSE